jgi:rfaE bifunctional protein kinase chain/domain
LAYRRAAVAMNAALIERAREIRELAGPSKRIAFVSGTFNVVHPGHLRLLKFAAEVSDFLVVGVNPDETPGVSVPAGMRVEAVRSISIVDAVVELSEHVERFICALEPEFVVKGKEFETRDNPEKNAVEAYGGKLVFSSGEVSFTSIALLQRGYSQFSTLRKPLDYPLRYGFEASQLKRTLAKYQGMRVLVIGDLIVDDYVSCDPLGLSPDDPTIVVTPVETKTFVGGAGVVSAHAKGLGANVRFCTVVGDDAGAKYSLDELSGIGVHVDSFVDRSRPTTRKVRYRALNKTLLRVNYLRQHAVNPDLLSQMLAAIERRLTATDLILFSDFNYGCLPQALVDAVVERASARNIMMAADSQASSQSADISRFKGMALVTPTEREARMALRDAETGLAALSEKLHEAARAKNVVITLSGEGLLVYGNKDGVPRTDRLPSFNSAPRDVAGAGDSLFTSTALALCVGADIWESVYIGSLAAACQVSRLGNAPLNFKDLIAEIDAPSN